MEAIWAEISVKILINDIIYVYYVSPINELYTITYTIPFLLIKLIIKLMILILKNDN